MIMKFSERHGFTPISQIIQKEIGEERFYQLCREKKSLITNVKNIKPMIFLGIC